jgi:prepilin-type N-terminal cleavage/methylation domain-containing protein
MRRTRNRQQGFSLIEIMMVVVIIMIMMSIAVLNVSNILPIYKANNAQDAVVSALRQARQTAIAQRRDVQVFIDQSVGADGVQHINCLVVTQPGDAPATLVSNGLPPGTQMTLNGTPDTPMGFGNNSAVYIGNTSGGPPFMYFRSTGSFTDQTYTPLNGTIFVGIPNKVSTARAVTILGGTGRTRAYSWNGTVWNE